MDNRMFCYQCQETARGKGCTQIGVCGKKPETAQLQDLLVYVTKGLSEILTAFRKYGKPVSDKYNRIVANNLFITITNANFDDNAILHAIKETIGINNELKEQLSSKTGLNAALYIETNDSALFEKAKEVGVERTENEDIRSLRELITYGLKGLSAYLKHAYALSGKNEEIDSFLQEALAKTLDDSLGADDLTSLALETGKYGVKVMELLDRMNVEHYGKPEITKVSTGVRKNPGILISGHDLRDLEMLLEQTEGTGVDVYTHCEMLPGHYYPAFKKYSHFVGNYGNAWWQQKEEFESFNGPILFTTNCIVYPKESYKNRIYTTGAAGFPGCKHIPDREDGTKDFSEIIEHAKLCESPVEIENGEIVGGFAHDQVLALSDKVVEAVKNGYIKKFVVMAGCDGRSKVRSYYTEFAESLPSDTVILTAGCAKYRYNKLKLGDIGGIPRVLDAGQCNDSYSLAVIAMSLKDAFGLSDINDLPIIYNIAWYEQKAVIVLLSLLHLGVKNIHLGPSLPGFLSPNVAKVLVDNFGIQCISTVKDDMQKFFGENSCCSSVSKITGDMLIGDILKIHDKAADILLESGMHCLGCPSSQMESLKEACLVHGIDVDVLLAQLNEVC